MSLESSINNDSITVSGHGSSTENIAIPYDEIIYNHNQSPAARNFNQSQSNTNNHHQHISHHERPNKPIGVAFFGAFFKFNSIAAKRTFHKALLLCITFIGYTCFHMGRRPLSIVKNVLNRNCSEVHNITLFDQIEDIVYIEYEGSSGNDTTWCDWAPFNDDKTANQLLALLDSAFLFSYAFFMFFSGFLADRCNLRYYLSGGMILSGVLLYAFGLAFYMNIHSMTYFVVIQILAGAIQTTGWPSVVTCIGNWFDNSSRGSIFGVWNSNTNLGNILGATISGYFVEKSWGLSFIVPGFIMLGSGVLVFLFLVPRPQDVGLLPIRPAGSSKSDGIPSSPYCDRDAEDGRLNVDDDDDIHNNHQTVTETTNIYSRGSANRRKSPRISRQEVDSAVSESDESQAMNTSEQSPLINDGDNNQNLNGDEIRVINQAGRLEHSNSNTVSFWTCVMIPGVIEYSLSLGFAKLVSYTFLYWLPRYITQSTLNNSEQSAYLSVPFDIGGMFGAIVAGYLSDRYKKSAVICTAMLILAIPAMLIYERCAAISNLYNIVLQLVAGFLVTGPYALITTAVSTDLGSRVKDGKAMATVAAIIDGTGSIGAAIGPLFAGYVSDSGWQTVFLMLVVSDLLASLCLTRVTLKELGFR